MDDLIFIREKQINGQNVDLPETIPVADLVCKLTKDIPYWDAANRGVDFKGILAALEAVEPRSVFLSCMQSIILNYIVCFIKAGNMTAVICKALFNNHVL